VIIRFLCIHTAKQGQQQKRDNQQDEAVHVPTPCVDGIPWNPFIELTSLH
jgi:hypothetical protein